MRARTTLLAVAVSVYLYSELAVVAEPENRASVKLLGSWPELRVMRNSGAVFGLGEAMTIVLTVIAATVALVIVRLARKLHSAPSRAFNRVKSVG
ncbi:hypothetical protein I5Q34_16180 [Streptomyces sp. AV19]|nr:hypothetical protein [Streptomyces sp. AV19]MBH1935790.1 hypothetical protein [Streptomyces sp. AV19]